MHRGASQHPRTILVLGPLGCGAQDTTRAVGEMRKRKADREKGSGRDAEVN